MQKGPAGWSKSPPALADAFAVALAEMAGAERRQMFGFPAAFVNGNLFTGLFGDRWFVRLPDDALAELASRGGSGFEPMPGRAMKGYLAMPADILADPVERGRWLDRAFAHVAGLPPKARR